MPQIVTCPDCGRKLKVPDDLLGKKVKCPGCSQKFVAEVHEEAEEPDDVAPSSSYSSRPSGGSRRRDDDDSPKSRRRAAEEDDEDYPASRRLRDEDAGPVSSKADVRQGWERVRFGVNLIIIGAWVLVGAIVVFVTGMLLVLLTGFASMSSIYSGLGTGGPVSPNQVNQAAGSAAGTGCAMMVGVIAVYGLAALLVLCYLGLSITGKGFFMGIAPTRKTEYLKWLAIAAFSLSLAWLVLVPLFWGLQFALLEARIGGCVIFSGYGLWATVALGEFICFFLFLRGVAAALRKDGLAQNIVFYMIAAPVFGLLTCGMAVILPFLGFAAMFGASASAMNANNNPSAAVGSFAGTGAAMAVGGLVCVSFVVLVAIALFVWFVVLLHQVRGALDGWLDRN